MYKLDFKNILKNIFTINFWLENRFILFAYRKTGKPILYTMSWCEKHVRLTIIILLIIGMGLRIGYRGMVERPERDEIKYLAMIEQTTVDEAIAPYAQRAMIYVGCLIVWLGGSAEIGIRCFNLICSFLWLCMMYFLGKSVFLSKNAGIACMTLAVFNPYTIRMAGMIMREPLYLLLFTLCIFCSVQIVRGIGVICYSGLMGPLSVLGIWSRVEGFEILLLVPLACIYRLCCQPHKSMIIWKNEIIIALLTYILTLTISMIMLNYYCSSYIEYFLEKLLRQYSKVF